MGLLQIVKAGVVSASSIEKIFEYAKKNNFAIPSVNVINNETINATLEAASKSNSTVILEISNDTAKYLGGKIAKGDASILGAITTANYVHSVAANYKVPVILSTSVICGMLQKDWLDILIELSEENYKKTNKPLFTIHSVDLTRLGFSDGMKLAQKYLKKLNKIGATLELRVDVNFIQPKELVYMYKELSKISTNFLVDINLPQENQKNHVNTYEKAQKYISKEFKTSSKPFNLVVDTQECNKEVKKCINTGVVKVNIQKDVQECFNEALIIHKDTSIKELQDTESRKLLREIQKTLVKLISSFIKEFNSKNTL